MVCRSSIGRRGLLAAFGAAVGGLAGCVGRDDADASTGGDGPRAASDGGGSATPTTGGDGPGAMSDGDGSATPTTTPTQPGTASCEVPADGEVTTLAAYECVTANREAWLGRTVSSTGRVGRRHAEDYVVFKHRVESREDFALPFFVKTSREFSMGTRYAFSGTVERVAEMGGKPSLFLEDPSLEQQ